MEYSAGNVSNLLWFVEIRETVKLLQNHNIQDVKRIVIEDNIYQQNTEKRLKSQFGCIKKRIDSIPVPLAKMMITSDINTSKIIALVAAMAADKLLFELMYEVYRAKLNMDEETLKDADLNMFFNRKVEQSDVIAQWSDSVIKKLKQTYCKYLQAAGLLGETVNNERKINRPYIDNELKSILLEHNMEKYLLTLTGER